MVEHELIIIAIFAYGLLYIIYTYLLNIIKFLMKPCLAGRAFHPLFMSLVLLVAVRTSIHIWLAGRMSASVVFSHIIWLVIRTEIEIVILHH